MNQAQTLEEAIIKFYQNPEENQALHQLITKEQRSAQAWEFCWGMLDLDKPQEVQFYAASALKLKIFKFWHEVPEEGITQLKDKLFYVLISHAHHSKLSLVTDKLAQALAGVVLQNITEEWESAITDLISVFQTLPQINEELRCRLLLRILSSIGDCLTDVNFGVKPVQRSAVHSKLIESFNEINELLNTLINNQNLPHTLKHDVTRCVISWVELGISLTDVESILDVLFTWLKDESLFDIIIDALVQIFDVKTPSQHTKLLEKYLVNISELKSLWDHLVQQEDLESCKSLANLVCQFSENNLNIMLNMLNVENKRHVVQNLIQLILSFADIKLDGGLSSISFSFWYNLQDEILGESNSTKCDLYLQIFKPVYRKLIDILLYKVQYTELSVYVNMSASDKEEFRKYREDISDVMMYTYRLLIDEMIVLLQGYLITLSQTLENCSWQQIEGLLYVIAHVTQDTLLNDESDSDDDLDKSCHGQVTVNKFISLIQGLITLISRIEHMFNNTILLNTCLECVGAFAEQYSLVPELLNLVMPVILTHGFNQPETLLLATRSLKDICSNNMELLAPHSEQILTVCHQKISDHSIQGKNTARLLSCMGHLLTNLPYTDIIKWLERILPPISQSLNAGMKSDTIHSTRVSVITEHLYMLGSLFYSLDLKSSDKDVKYDLPDGAVQPVLIVLKDLLPVLKSILSEFCNHDEILQSCIDVIKRALLTLHEDFSSVLEDVCQILITITQHKYHTSIYDLIDRMSLIFSYSTDSNFNLIKQLHVRVADTTLSQLESDPQTHTAQIDSYVALMSQMCSKCKSIVNQSDYPLHKLIKIAAIGLGLPERTTVRSCSSLFKQFFKQTSDFPSLQQIMPQTVPLLFNIMLTAIGGSAPRLNVYEYYPHIIFCLLKNYPQISADIITTLLSMEGFPRPRLTLEEKRQFAQQLIKERNKKKIETLIERFSLKCSGLEGTEYGEQTTGQHVRLTFN